jgi:Cyclopropane fatty acid synthase and related methyltransferases
MKRILNIPSVYNFWVNLVFKNKDPFFQEFLIKHEAGIKMLDIGCGPGRLSHHFWDTIYTGMDLSQKYIDMARRRYRDFPSLSFYCADVNNFFTGQVEHDFNHKFDLIFMFGLLHHLNDAEVDKLMSTVSTLLRPCGMFRSLDGVFTENQSRIDRFILKNDRGKFVRTEKEYLDLIRPHLPNAQYGIRSDLLIFPYSIIFFY